MKLVSHQHQKIKSKIHHRDRDSSKRFLFFYTPWNLKFHFNQDLSTFSSWGQKTPSKNMNNVSSFWQCNLPKLKSYESCTAEMKGFIYIVYPYSVPRRALKGKCDRRTKQLYLPFEQESLNFTIRITGKKLLH